MDGDETGSDTGYTGDNGEQQGSGGHPAWDEFLQIVPQELHPQVTPILEKWDKGVNEKVQKVHSEYEPWKPILKSADPNTAEFALNLLNAINENPEMVYKAIGEYYKIGGTGDSKSGQGQEEPKEEDPYDSRIKELERHNQILARNALEQREKEMVAQAEAELDNELTSLKKKYGDYNEKYVLAMMQNGSDAEDAVKSYFEWRDQEVKKHVPKPLIMGGGGGLPNQNANPSKWSDKETKSMVAQMLEHHARQNQ